ncbi:hypothetical protein B296_00045171 [Ensete ventricosum]|uniref:DUF3741 domain-containing protein n=1 Tax=Ensete ventricosum TaxID=4639 RepID=A0A426XGV6_ENSVE|nr:hypothetical protein B296_00045171 [Ensete ventricosum]
MRPACASRWMLWRSVSAASLYRRVSQVVEDLPHPSSAQLVALPYRMDLGDLRGMTKMSGGKTSSVRTAVPAREVGVSLVREAPKASSKRPIDASIKQVDDPARWPKKVKVLTMRHKSRHDEGGSRSHSKGKEPVAPAKELESPVESNEGDASPVHHRPRSMKELFKTKVHKDDAGYYALHMSDLGHQDPDKEMKARCGGAEKLDERLE